MKNMKKILFAGLAAAVLLTAVLPAMAEAGAKAPAMGQQQAMGGKGGRGMQQPGMGGRGQMNGQFNPGMQPSGGKGGRGMQNGQAPQQPESGSGAAQNDPAAPESDATSGATKDQRGFRGFGRGGRHGRVSYDELLKDGVITQETYDAIQNYLKEKQPALPGTAADNAADSAAAEGEVPPEKPEDGELPPELPQGETMGEDPALAGLLADGVITQEQYDAIVAAHAEQPQTDTADAAADDKTV